MKNSKLRKRHLLLFVFLVSLLNVTPSYALTKRVRTMTRIEGVQNANIGSKTDIRFKDSVNWGSNDIEAYHKLEIPKTGRLEIQSSTKGVSFYACLCDSDYRTVQTDSTGSYVSNDYISVLGVKQGTYYIRVRGCPSYSLDVNFTPMTDSGSSKSNAKYVKKTGKNTTSVMPVGENTTNCDWYRIYIPYRQKVRLYYYAAGLGRLSFYLLTSSNRVVYNKQIGLRASRYLSRHYSRYGNASYPIDGLTKYITLNKGTYYVKVMRTRENKYKRTSACSWFNWTNG